MKKVLLLTIILISLVNSADAAEKRDGYGRTDLMNAAKSNDVDAVKKVMYRTEDINTLDYKSNNSYCYAYNNRNVEMAKILEMAGSNINQECYIDGVLFQSKSLQPKGAILKTAPVFESKTAEVAAEQSAWSHEVPRVTMPAMPEIKASTALYAVGSTVAVVGVATAFGSGGNGGGLIPDPVDHGVPSDYETAEFYGEAVGATSFLDDIGAQHAYARGYNGEGVTIAILDTGIDIDHSEFTGQLHSNLSNTNQSTLAEDTEPVLSGDLDDPNHEVGDNDHGSLVASYAAGGKNGSGMHGVAYESIILPYRMIMENTSDSGIRGWRADNAIADGISKGAFVYNMSYNAEASVSDNAALADEDLSEGEYTGWFVAGSSHSTFMDDMISNITTGNSGDGAIMVVAAGNEGYSESGSMSALPLTISEFDGYFINAVALDETNDAIASYSNLCGVTKNYCLSAPGSIVMGANGQGGYSLASGTSFAAPIISGAAAVIKDAFPYMDAPEITALMFTTADDLGAVGVDDVYGQGRLNLNAATSPGVGTSAFTSSGRVVSYDGTRITTSSAFAMPSISTIAMTDDLNRTFHIEGNSITGLSDEGFDMIDRAKSFAQSKKTISTDLGGGFATSFTMGNEEGKQYDFAGIESMEFSSSYGDGLDIKFGYSEAPGTDYAGEVESTFLLQNEAISHPFLNLASNGFTAGTKYAISDNINVENNVFFGEFKDDDNRDLGGTVVSMTKFGYETSKGALGLELGVMSEEGTVLGSKFEGAFSLGNDNSTYFSGITGDVSLTDNFKLFGNAYIGRTKINTATNSLVNSIDSIVSKSASAGAEYSFNQHKAAGLILSQPLKVSSGSMGYDLATSRGSDGEYTFESFNQDLSSGATEFDVQAYYKHQLYEQTDLNFGAIYRMNADYEEGKSETAAMLKLHHKF